MAPANEIAPEGFVFVCLVCGRMSRDKYGEYRINPGWDESCILNSELYDEKQLEIGEGGRVVGILNRGVDE